MDITEANHVKVEDTGSVPSGEYQGWGGASWTNPPNIEPPTEGAFGWSIPVDITC
jgi:hypothetical protein